MRNIEKVRQFMETFGQTTDLDLIPSSFKALETLDLRTSLIKEEYFELYAAVSDYLDGHATENQVQCSGAAVEIVDALADLLYVVYGACIAFGIDADKAFEIVHSSNMSKLGIDGKPRFRNDGKVLKGPNYFKPDLRPLVKNYVD
jgi:predicted HAD superfamily Cof-like phosphohydrolase